jgi:hypothetical protein
VAISSDKNGGGGAYTYNMATPITINQWHYFIYNSNADGTTAVYIDGVRSTNTQVDTYNYTTATDTIGRYYGGYWPGYWTNMRITRGTAVYNSNLTTQAIPNAPLTSLGNTKYLMLGSNVTTDSSGIQTVTNNNTVTISALQPCPGPTPTPTPTRTSTTTPTPTVTPTPTSTPAGIQATIEFSFFNNGYGGVRAKMSLTSGITLDSLSWGGIGIGYSGTTCVGSENLKSFSDVFGIGATEVSTAVWDPIDAILSANLSTFSVAGNTINTNYQTIIVGGHQYLITNATDCFPT